MRRRKNGSYVGNNDVIQPPVLQAMVLADQIYTDVSGKRIICGTFSSLHVSQLPVLFGRKTYVFILLVDIVGRFSLQLRFVHLSDNKILMHSEPINFESDDPLKPLDISIEVPPFPLIDEGFYSLECWAEEHLLGAVRLQVVKAKKNERE